MDRKVPGLTGRSMATGIPSRGRALAVLRACASGGVLAMALTSAGCQTSDPVSALDPPAFETGILSSNELNRLGRSDLAAGNNGMAERHLRAAVEKDKDDAPSWIGLAAAYDNLGRFELADRAYEQATRIDGETFVIINNRGYSFLLRGDQKRALAQFRRALALDPGNPVIRNNIKLLQSGERPNRAVPL